MKRVHEILLLKNQLMIYFIIISFIPTTIISLFYYFSSREQLMNSMGESHYKIVLQVMNDIDMQYQQANQAADWIYLDKNIHTLLKRDHDSPSNYDEIKEKAIENTDDQFKYSPVMQYVSSLFVLGKNHIDIRNGIDAYLINVDDLMGENWFKEGIKGDGKIHWSSITKNYTSLSYNTDIIPQMRVMKDIDNGKLLGYYIVLFNEKLFKDCFNNIFNDNGENVYLMDQDGNIILSNDENRVANSQERMITNDELLKNQSSYFKYDIDGTSYLVVKHKSSKTAWSLVEFIPMSNLQKQKQLLSYTFGLIILGIFCMSILFSFYLSRHFTKPINMIIEQVKEISHGNFTKPLQLETYNELTQLGDNITKMGQDLDILMTESLKKERDKRDLEIKMLQAQINPHFLNNTLNSVKWMATLQGAEGIKEMVSRLGRLLRLVLEDTNEKIKLDRELEILDDYIYIQKIRYKGKIKFYRNLQDETLLQCYVLKFILQPIVENSIFHGIEPKDGIGEIMIEVRKHDKKLYIDVIDNGLGMSQEKIQLIFNGEEHVKHSKGFNQIGLRNIHDRIKLIYGEGYGLDIESVMGEYTKVTVKLPIEM